MVQSVETEEITEYLVRRAERTQIMKKLLTLCFIVILALCFALPSFAMVPPPDPYHPQSLDAYNELLQSVDVPKGFIYYQDISFLGKFVEFEFTQETLDWNLYRYTLQTYEEEVEEINGEYYAGNTFTVDIQHAINYSLPQITIPKDQILESEELRVYYSGSGLEGWDIGTYGEDEFGALHLVLERGDGWSTIASEDVLIYITISPTDRDWYMNYYAEQNETPIVYSPYEELYQQWYFDDHRADMVRSIVSALVRRGYEKQYEAVFESYVDLVSGPQNPRYALDLNDFTYLGTLKSYQFDEGSNYETGEFRFATPDPEIDIILTVKDWDPSANANEPSVTTEIPEGPDLRGQSFCRKYTNGEVVFGENEIVVKNSRYKKIMTLKTSPESALSNYPMYYDGGGFLSLLLSAEKNEYCSEYLFSSLAMAVAENPYYRSPNTSSDTTNSASTNTDSTTDLPIDEGTDGVTDTANAEDLTGTTGNPVLTDGANATDCFEVPTEPLPSTATPADPAPFPWLWVIVPAGVVLIAAAAVTAALVIRKKKKQESP